jgi:hypothetical protein
MTYNKFGTVAPGDVLRATSGTAAYNGMITNVNNYRVPPIARYRRTAVQGIPDNTDTLVAWTNEIVNTDGMVNTSGAITVKTAGAYIITLGLVFAPNTTGIRAGIVTVNSTSTGADSSPLAFSVNNSGAGVSANSASAIVNLAADDVIRAYAFQNSTATLNISGSSSNLNRGATQLSLAWIGQVS